MTSHSPASSPELQKPAEWALQLAAQAWCEPSCSDIEVDARLTNVFAQMLTRLAASFEADRAGSAAAALAAEREFYRHVKTGGDYEWLCSALRESDLVPVVMYQSVETGVRYVRPSKEFYDGRFVDIPKPAAPTGDQA